MNFHFWVKQIMCLQFLCAKLDITFIYFFRLILLLTSVLLSIFDAIGASFAVFSPAGDHPHT